jgi:hypothetical protein
MFPDRLIGDDSLRTDADGFSFEARIPWYRALPLASVTGVRVVVDGEPVDADDVTFGVNGRRYRLDELPPRHDEWWYVTDGAEIRVRRAGGLGEGAHEVDLTLGIHIPYLVFDGETLVVTERCVKPMTARMEVAA